MEEFKLPKRWCIKFTYENTDVLKKWIISHEGYDSSYDEFKGYCLSDSGWDNSYMYWGQEILINYTEITFDQFKQYVLKEQIVKCPFKVGDIIELINDKNFAAKNGDTAKVISINEYPEYIKIEWLTKTIQSNGEYFPTDFKLHEKDWTKASKDELLIEAQRRYPIGTEFNSPYARYSYAFNQIIEEAKFKWYNDETISVKKTSKNNEGIVYENGKWAEIISLPEKIEEKPQFEVGKWYYNSDKTFAKVSKITDNGFDYDEWILNGIYDYRPGWWGIHSNMKEATLEEIQQYLPNWHPDKIKVTQNIPERISFYVKYSEEFTEDLYNALWEWSKKNSEFNPRGYADSYEGLKKHKYYLFDNWTINRQNKYRPEGSKISYGVDNNEQFCLQEYTIQQVKDLIGYKELNVHLDEFPSDISIFPIFEEKSSIQIKEFQINKNYFQNFKDPYIK